MYINELIETLHPLERKVLPVLKENIELKELINKTKLEEVEVIRALQWLQNKKIIEIKEELKEVISLDKNGQEYVKTGLPETRFLRSLAKELSFDEIKKKANLTNEEFNISLGFLKRNDLISISNNKIKITEKGKKHEETKEKFLKKLPIEMKDLGKQKEIYEELKKRKEIIKVDIVKLRYVKLTELGKKLMNEKISDDLIDTLTTSIIKSNAWKNKKFRRYDIKVNVPKIYPGKRHFVNQAIQNIKKIWLDMGFKEMQGSLVQTSFWNFDTLFTAQDHPVRELQDTYFIKNPSNGNLPDKELVKKVKLTHENGWTTNSKGWQYSWDEKEAKRNVLRTHTTVLSAKTISMLKQSDLPCKFFSVGKVFRNETLDWKHLFEFYQVEGIVVDENANFRHLLGYLKEYYKKLGFEKVRFRPAYFPYTEFSVEPEVFHPVRKEWIELGGAGIFRPEVVKPLLGKDIPVLAWGQGMERSIIDYYNIKDLREVYNNDLKKLREFKLWLR